MRHGSNAAVGRAPLAWGLHGLRRTKPGEDKIKLHANKLHANNSTAHFPLKQLLKFTATHCKEQQHSRKDTVQKATVKAFFFFYYIRCLFHHFNSSPCNQNKHLVKSSPEDFHIVQGKTNFSRHVARFF